MMTNVAQNEQQQKTTVKSVVRVWTWKNMQFSLKNIVSSAPNAEIRWFFFGSYSRKGTFCNKSVCMCSGNISYKKHMVA